MPMIPILHCSLKNAPDLKIYRAQLQRILANTLYFLLIQASGETFYKIGVTRRPPQERVTEIHARVALSISTSHYQNLGDLGTQGQCGTLFQT
ncbi:hypothetical protein [Scytonema sp. NUACC26]|uniref:hypothetical protein n=1 Tax=Scytonema sp. NUACC26 TaxID=3140176 RepID=UPI0038B266A4